LCLGSLPHFALLGIRITRFTYAAMGEVLEMQSIWLMIFFMALA
jgi:hypothetical protein